LWSRIVANGDEPDPRQPPPTAAASWIRTAVSAADAVTTWFPPGPQTAEQDAGEPDLCASRSLTARPFMVAAAATRVRLWGLLLGGVRGWGMGCLDFFFGIGTYFVFLLPAFAKNGGV
jgi:hypothetical protein